MRPLSFNPQDLRKHLLRHKIATLPELKAALGTSADLTVFRKLKLLDYLSSYTHRGRYYALREAARFDDIGLWSHDAVWFSRYGTLVSTIESFVNQSPSGWFADELADVLHAEVQDPLHDLVRAERLRRSVVAGRFLYTSADGRQARDQLRTRQTAQSVPLLTDASALQVSPDELKAAILLFYSLLDEQQRRLFAGLESIKLGHGGDSVLAEFLGLDPHTVARGRQQLLDQNVSTERTRRSGGGRKPVEKTADIVTLIEFLLEYDTAGDPITGLKWSRRTTEKIALALGDFGVSVSPNTVARLLHQMGYSLRVNHKKLSTDFSPDRNDQFLYLSDLRQRFQRRGLPIISVDTKKRELVGNFKNPGARWDLSPRLVNDHDFRSDSTGVAIPYGIYDLLANRGAVMVGVSHDTSAFAAHAIAHWWRQEGAVRYPRSRQLLILSDTGGSNGARRRTWKTELQSQLADSLGLTLTVAHYPTGASKWNPIEHRLFSEISKNWAGEPLDTYQKILNFIRSTRTNTGLSVTAQLDRRNYPTGAKPTPEQLQSLRLKPHQVLPKWNYTISPNL